MSLHTLAHHLQSAGRGDDKVLVHMTPGEVHGLQALAKAHGGSLTTNPETGLPEAGFLSSLLPMIAGVALTGLSGGAINPMTAGFLVGGGTAAATGSLKKGLMAGLGAYGGAGLAGGLSSLGTAAVAPATPAATAEVAGLTPSVSATSSTLGGTTPFAGAGTPDFSLTGDIFKNTVASNAAATPVAAATSGMTPSALTQTPLYPDVNFATGMSSPTASVTKPFFSAAEKQAEILSSNVGDPNAYVVTNVNPPVVSNPHQAGLLAESRYTPDYVALSKASPRPPFSTPISPDSQYFADISSKIKSLPAESQLAQAPTVSTTATATPTPSAYSEYMSRVGQGAKTALSGTDGLKALYSAQEAAAPYSTVAGLGSSALTYYDEKREEAAKRLGGKQSPGMIRPYEFDYGATNVAAEPYSGSAERTYFQPTYTALTPYEAPGPEYAAKGGLMGLAVGGPVEEMSAMNAVGGNTAYPQSQYQTAMYSNPMVQRPMPTEVVAPSVDAGVDPYSGEARFAKGGGTAEPDYGTPSGYKYAYDPKTMQFTQVGAPNRTVSGGIATPITQPAAPAQPFIPNINIPAYQTPEQQLGLGGFYDYMNQQLGGYGGYAAGGGVSHLGDYSDGGRLLRGPGDGVSDSIPASIGGRQPARLADGEFVVPARIVSELGNGSTEAGARKLYAMMDRIQKARRKTVGKNQVAKNTKAEKLLPA